MFSSESGYGEPPQRLIEGLLGVGAVGFNIEDTVHHEGKRQRSVQEHAELVGRLRAAAQTAGGACGDQRPHRSAW